MNIILYYLSSESYSYLVSKSESVYFSKRNISPEVQVQKSESRNPNPEIRVQNPVPSLEDSIAYRPA